MADGPAWKPCRASTGSATSCCRKQASRTSREGQLPMTLTSICWCSLASCSPAPTRTPTARWKAASGWPCRMPSGISCGPVEGESELPGPSALATEPVKCRQRPSPDHHRDDDEVLAAFRAYLGREVSEEAVRLLDRRLDGASLRQLASDASFGVSGWALRRLAQRVREAAMVFARRHDEGLVRAVERLLPARQEHVEEAAGGWMLAG